MKIFRMVQIVAVLALILAVTGGEGRAFGADIKERMRERLPVITELKDAGVIGENNAGFLEYLSDKHPQEEVVRAENDDRARIYQAIARQQQTSPELVGTRRARQIADRAAPGEWLQDAKGDWYQKK